MPWLRFTGHFNWHVPSYKGRVTIAYKAGMTEFVPRACAAAACAAGKAEPAERPAEKGNVSDASG